MSPGGPLTRRGRWALGLGGAAYLAAWAFGSKPLYPIAIGLLLAVGLAWAWVHLSYGAMRLRRAAGRGDHFEGDDVTVELELEREGRIPPPSIRVVERIAKLGERETPLGRHGRRLSARYVLSSLPRGRYPLEAAHAVLEDPFGLERVEVPLRAAGTLLVYPRLVQLERLFSETGSRTPDGRRLLLRRPSGFDLHSVREYEEGESLRMVHWRSTARRGRLMVKELEDAPRDEVAVLLDADASAVVGKAPESSFDLQVRAAGSILQAHARSGRRAVLIVNSAPTETVRVHSFDGDWRRALAVLAAAEPTAARPAAALLGKEASPAVRALELTVVTASLSRQLADRLLQRALGHRSISLVFVDPRSFNATRPGMRPRAPLREPLLLRLQAAGVPVAVLRRGDDLAAKLGRRETRRAARA